MASKIGLSFALCFYIILLNMCSFITFGEEENLKEKAKSGEVKHSEDGSKVSSTEISRNGLVPGEVVIGSQEGRTSQGEKAISDEKKVEIKQSVDGKTTEETKASEESKQEEMAGNVDKKETSEEEKKEDEKKPEEAGIELKVLKDHDFEHLTQAASGATTGDWLVLFSTNDACIPCTEAEKEMKIVYERTKHKLNVAKVEKGSSSKLTFKRFNIENLPVVFLYSHGKKYLFEGNKTVEALLTFVDGGYKMSSWTTVREPYTYFEFFVDESIDELKHMLRYKKNVSVIIFLTGFAVGISVTSICGSILFHLLENFKDDEEDELSRERRPQVSDMAKSKNE